MKNIKKILATFMIAALALQGGTVAFAGNLFSCENVDRDENGSNGRNGVNNGSDGENDSDEYDEYNDYHIWAKSFAPRILTEDIIKQYSSGEDWIYVVNGFFDTLNLLKSKKVSLSYTVFFENAVDLLRKKYKRCFGEKLIIEENPPPEYYDYFRWINNKKGHPKKETWVVFKSENFLCKDKRVEGGDIYVTSLVVENNLSYAFIFRVTRLVYSADGILEGIESNDYRFEPYAGEFMLVDQYQHFNTI